MKYTPKRPEIPPDISPGPLFPVYFSGLPIAQWGKAEPEVLIKRIREKSEGTEGLSEIKMLTAKKLQAVIGTVLKSPKEVLLTQKAIQVQRYVEGILLCQPFLAPITFNQVKAFVDENRDKVDVGGLVAILQEQEELYLFVLQYQSLISRQVITDFPAAISAFLITMESDLPAEKQPKHLIELLKKSETSTVTWRQLGSCLKSLKNGLYYSSQAHRQVA